MTDEEVQREVARQVHEMLTIRIQNIDVWGLSKGWDTHDMAKICYWLKAAIDLVEETYRAHG